MDDNYSGLGKKRGRKRNEDKAPPKLSPDEQQKRIA